jgi:hypothetical protein
MADHVSALEKALRRGSVLALAALLFYGQSPPLASGASPTALSIDGFLVEMGELSADQERIVMPSLRTQVSIVNTVGLPESVLEFMRSVPIVIEATAIPVGGQYKLSDGRWIVALPPEAIPSTRPVLLHELLHAFHLRVLGQKTEILNNYQAAIQSEEIGGRYRGSHFLQDQREFFAIASTVYLFRKIKQPPYNCSGLRRELPDFLSFLGTIFGPHECN